MKTLEKQQAVLLRQQGLSYKEILDSLAASQSSLSRWLRNVELTPDQHARIHRKNLAVRQRFVEWNSRRRIETRVRKDQLASHCAAEIGELSLRELQLIGVSLYWAEGSKGMVEFVNADPNMIRLVMQWFRRCCQVPESKFRAKVQLYDLARREDTERFWSTLTGIPLQQFTKPIDKLSPGSRRKRGNTLPYGTLHIRISDVQLLTKIQGWIHGLNMAPSSSPA